jgi:uncharacterized protein YkwD
MARTGAGAAVLLMVVAGMAVLRSSHSDLAQALTNCSAPAGEELLNAQEQQMLAALNDERTSRGIAALKPSPSLNRAAAWKSLDSSAVPPAISHTDSFGRSPSERARDCGYPAGVGENAAWGYQAVQATVAAWMNSEGHRSNILNPSWVVIGIGLGQGTAWTLDFGAYDDSGTTPTATTTPSATATRTPTMQPSPTPTPTAVPTFSMQLERGANFVVYLGPARNVAQATASLGEALIGVYHWDAANGRWERWVPGAPAYVSNFSSMRPGEAYAILLSGAATWAY